MRRLLITLVCLAGAQVARATTFHTIPRFSPDFGFVADEAFLTSTPSRSVHLTWDTDWLYVGNIGEPAIPPLPMRRMVWYFDTDPQPVPMSGAGTATAIPFGTQTWTLPFFADYALILNSGPSGLELRRWNTSSWVPVSAPLWAESCWCGASLYWHKMGVQWAWLGAPSRIYATGFTLSEESGAETTYASWPSDALVGGDGYKPAGVLAHWFGWTLGPGISPNDPAYHDQTLPVELMTFSVE
jgi:hypothetical protein